MEIKVYISDLYPIVAPYKGINSIEDMLLENEYLVVIDIDEYIGILTPRDLIKHPHKIVIDCLTAKEHIMADDTVISVFDKFRRNKCSVLPVFHENKFIGIIEKNTLINKLKSQVNQLYDNLIISQNLKLSFLNSLSHEIRTPLNGVLGFLEIMSDFDIEDFKANGELHYNIIKKSADRFLLVMNDLVDLSLIHSGDKIKITNESVTIETIFSDLKELFEASTSSSNKDVSVQYINPEASMTICSDRKKIEHILYHLIDNAIKFSTEGKVKFGYETNNENIIFFVTNNGHFHDEKAQIFEAFYKQGNNKEYSEGLGIGLALVKKMTELLEGTVDYFTTETETTFNVTLPLSMDRESVCIKPKQQDPSFQSTASAHGISY